MIELSPPLRALLWLTGAVLLFVAAGRFLPRPDETVSLIGVVLAALVLVAVCIAVARVVGGKADAARDARTEPRTVVLLMGEEVAAREHARELLGLEIQPNFDGEGAIAYVQERAGRVFLEKAPMAGGHTSRLQKYVNGAVRDPHMVGCVHRLATLIETDRAAVGEERPWVTTLKNLQLPPSPRQGVHVALLLSLRGSVLGSLLSERVIDLGDDPLPAISALQHAVWRGLTTWLEKSMSETPQEQQRRVLLAAEAHRELTTLSKHLSHSEFPAPWTWNRTFLLNEAAGDREVFPVAIPATMRSPVGQEKFIEWIARRFVAAPPAPERIPVLRVLWVLGLAVVAVAAAMGADVKPRSDAFWAALKKANDTAKISAVCEAYAGPGLLRLLHKDELEGLARQDACGLPNATDDPAIAQYLRMHEVSTPEACLPLIRRTIEAHCDKPAPTDAGSPTTHPTSGSSSTGTTTMADCAALTNLLAKERAADEKLRQHYPFDSTSASYLAVEDWPSKEADDDLRTQIAQAPKACKEQQHADIRHVDEAVAWRKKVRSVVSADVRGNLVMYVLLRMSVDGGSCPEASPGCKPSLSVAGETLEPIGYVGLKTVLQGSFCWAPGPVDGLALYRLKLGTHRHISVDVPLSASGASSHAQVISKHDSVPGAGPWSFLDLTGMYTEAPFLPLHVNSNPSLRFGSVALPLGDGLGTLKMEVIPVGIHSDARCEQAAPGGGAVVLPEVGSWLDFLQYAAKVGEGAGDGGPRTSAREPRYQVLLCGGRNRKPCTVQPWCSGSLVECGGVCADTDSDIKSCGPQCKPCVCDAIQGCKPDTIDAFQVCKSGSCSPCGGRGEEACPGVGCRDGLKRCGAAGICASTTDDPMNCGDCGHGCSNEPNTGATPTCVAGRCKCADNHDRCGDVVACTPLTTKEHCGNCKACGGAQPACLPSGDGGMTCVDLASNPQNCGAVGHACGSAPELHERTLCVEMKCACLPEWVDLDADAGNGCEMVVDAGTPKDGG